jgi:iron-sulfur cluster repair protein YtfE (RIC family)
MKGDLKMPDDEVAIGTRLSAELQKAQQSATSADPGGSAVCLAAMTVVMQTHMAFLSHGVTNLSRNDVSVAHLVAQDPELSQGLEAVIESLDAEMRRALNVLLQREFPQTWKLVGAHLQSERAKSAESDHAQPHAHLSSRGDEVGSTSSSAHATGRTAPASGNGAGCVLVLALISVVLSGVPVIPRY